MKPENYKQIQRVYAQIDLDAIEANVRNMFANIDSSTQIVLVIKTDGYGHGAVQIAHEMEKKDYIWGYATATAEEALQLRKSGLSKPILILGYTFDYAYKDLISNNIRPAVFKIDMLKQINDVAAELGMVAPVHIKVDTGMSRIGVMPDDNGLQFVKEALSLNNIKIEGIFTHFARADEIDKKYAYLQIDRFKSFTDRIKNELNYDVPYKHCSNSAGIIELPEANMNLVRAGITLYGLWPSEEVKKDIVSLTPVMELKSHIVYIKEVEPDTQISYGGTYVASEKRKIATIPVGYGDGYPRGLSNKGEVLIRGQRVPICGRVCMDQFMVDVTELSEVQEGDLVTLFGKDGDDYISMEEVGNISGRFNYELACDIGKRVPRVYVQDSEVKDIILDGISIK